MKIGILTLPLHINFGGYLQNYALQQVLIKMGHEPITLNQRVIPRPVLPQLKNIWLANFHTFILMLIGKKGNRSWQHFHGSSLRPLLWKNSIYFYDKYIKHSEPLNPNEDYNGICEKMGIDALIVGSDQVWRPRYVENISTMYFSFEKSDSIKKISYAASFGTDSWEYTEQHTSECSTLAKQFDKLTVRERSAINLMQEKLGVMPELVLDPTLLLSKEDYIKLIEEEQEAKSERNLFCYILDMTDKKTAFIKNVEHKLNLKSFNVNIGKNTLPYSDGYIKSHVDEFRNPTITKWLRGFWDADMVIADSFHAVAFSIIFNKPFWVIGNKSRGMARFESILSIFHLENRLVDESSLNQVDLNEPIVWADVNKIRKDLESKSKSLLFKALS